MSGVSLTEALAIAARYTDPKQSGQGLHVVVLRNGRVRATNHMSGCEIPCEAVEGLDLAVDCAALRRMVAAIGDGVKLAKISGRKLSVTGSGSKFKLQAITASKEPMFPKIPEGAWSDVSRAYLTALSKLASMVDAKSEKPAFTGMRLTPDWCAATDGQSMGYAWIKGLVDAPFTCPPGMFSDLPEDGTLCVDEGKLYLRGVTSGQIRWSTGIDAPFPDDGMVQMLAQARGRDRWTATIELGDLTLLCRQAGVVNEGTSAQTFKLTMQDDALTIQGHHGKAEFNGSTPVTDLAAAKGEVDYFVGVDTKKLETVAALVAAAGGTAYIAIAGQMNPIMIWNHGAEVIVETLLMPRRLGA